MGNAHRLATLGLLAFFPAGLASCGGHGVGAALPSAAGAALNARQGSEIAEAVPHLVYVANAGNGIDPSTSSITAYRLSARGDAAPVLKIAGPKTRLQYLAGVAAGVRGTIYALNGLGAVLRFAASSTGDVAPRSSIECGGMFGVDSIAVDPWGTVAVSSGHADDPGAINFFDADDTGCISGNPVIAGPDSLTISSGNTQLGDPSGVGIAPDRSTFVLNPGIDYGVPSVTVYARGATGNVAPIRTVAGPATHLDTGVSAIALGGQDDMYVTDTSGKILAFEREARGNVAPEQIISGTHTTLQTPLGIAALRTGQLFVANYQTSEIAVFAPRANGDAMPVSTIAGPHTGLDHPVAISIAP